MRLALKIVGAVVAPTTLLTGLLYYFGRGNATGYFGYFGVNVSVLDLTVQDYLIRGVDGMVVPLIAIAGITLLPLWIYHLLLDALPTEARQIVRRVLMPSAAIVGLVLVSVAMVDLFQGPLFWAYPEVRGLSLSIGVLLLAYAAQLVRLLTAERRPERLPRQALGAAIVAEWGAVFILVSVGLYWAVGTYAIGVGRGNAYKTEASLRSFPDIVAYSEQTLNLRAPGIREGGLPIPGRGIPVPLRRAQARAAVRESVPLPARRLDTRERRGNIDPAQRSAAAGVQPRGSSTE